MAQMYAFLFVFSVVLPFCTGDTAGIEVTCPALFIDGGDNDITCQVNTIDVSNAMCLAAPTTVTFSVTTASGGSPSTLCSTPYNPQDCNSGNVPASNGCGCTGKDGDVETYTLKFPANRSRHSGVDITCAVCVPQGTLSTKSVNCENIAFQPLNGAGHRVSLHTLIMPVSLIISSMMF